MGTTPPSIAASFPPSAQLQIARNFKVFCADPEDKESGQYRPGVREMAVEPGGYGRRPHRSSRTSPTLRGDPAPAVEARGAGERRGGGQRKADESRWRFKHRFANR